MSELRNLLALWESAKDTGDEIILGTVVRVEGSSYRKPGARILLTRSGRRSGMISGGCLEAEVSRKAWWLTEGGASLQSYSTFFDEDNPTPHGLGCGGTIHLLLERRESAARALQTIRESVVDRVPSAMLTVINSEHPGMPSASRLIANGRGELSLHSTRHELTNECWEKLPAIALSTLQDRRSNYISVRIDAKPVELFAEYIAPPQALVIFGAGDDTAPVVEFASGLGWHVTVADFRSHLATAERFPRADKVVALKGDNVAESLQICPDDAVVIMTHSYMQDGSLLRDLLPRQFAYFGLLGPKLRSSRLVAEVAAEINLDVNECAAKIHSPVGLDIGGDNPAAIALSIVAGVQAAVHCRGVRDVTNHWDVREATKSSSRPRSGPRHLAEDFLANKIGQ